MTKPQKILIYRDYGASIGSTESLREYFGGFVKPHGLTTQFTSAAEIIQNGLSIDQVAAFVMPGGQSRAFAAKLRGAGNRIIRNYVEAGGLYYGFCGGAYYACRTVDFTGAHFKIRKTHELDFFTGQAIGALPDMIGGREYDGTVNGAGVVPLSYESKQVDCYYNGGPRFEDNHSQNKSDKNAEVIATYVDGSSAALRCEVGKGCAVLIAAHPETTGEKLRQGIFPGMKEKKHIEEISERLITDHVNRDNFQRFLLGDLIPHQVLN